MTVNYSKSSVMWFRVSNRRLPHGYPPIMMDDVILSVVPKQKYFGLIFDERLTWYYHVSKVCKSVSYYLHLLCKHQHVLTDDFLKTLAESLVFSHLIYCLPVWGPSLPHCSFERIKRMQNRAVRLCRCLHKYDHVSHHYHSLNWLPFELLVQYRSLCALHRMFKYQRLPLDPPIVFGSTRSYHTRTFAIFAQLMRCRLSFAQKHFRYKSTMWWNALPEEMVMARDFSDELYFCLLSVT